MTGEGFLQLLAAIAEGLLAGVLAGAVIAFLFNNLLTRLRESPLKKIAPLALLPVAAVAGAGHGWAAWHGEPRILLPVALGLVVVIWSAAGAVSETRRNRPFQRRRLRTGVPALNPRTTPIPLNRGGVMQWRTLTVGTPTTGSAAGPPIRVLFLADFHLHPALNTDFIRAAVRHALDSRPDVVLLGGDFVTKRPQCEEAAALLKEFDWPALTFAVRGNHDFWTRAEFFRRALANAGIRLLSNEAIRVRTASGGELVVVGLEDPYIPLTPREEMRLRARITELEAGERLPRLGLVHTPEVYRVAARLGCDLAFAGHTHGGQVRLPLFGTTISSCPVRRRYAYGTAWLGGMRTMTTNGLGAYYGVRWRCPPEVLEVQLGQGQRKVQSAR